MSRKLVLKELPVMVFDAELDAERPEMKTKVINGRVTETQEPATFRYRAILISLLTASKEQLGIDDMVTREELKSRLIAAKNGDEILLEEAEHELLKSLLTPKQFPTSNRVMVQLKQDVDSAEKIAPK